MKHMIPRCILKILIPFALLTACAVGEQARQTAAVVNTPTMQPYSLLDDETAYKLPTDGQGQVLEGLDIGVGNVRTESYVDRSGASVNGWRAGLWLDNDICVGGASVHIGDTVEFAGYHLRVVSITHDEIVLAISGQLAEPAQIASDCVSSPDTRLISETAVRLYHTSEKSGPLVFEKIGQMQTESYIAAKGETITGPAIMIRITSENGEAPWEGKMHVGDAIQYGIYRVRMQEINDTFIDLVYK